MQSFLDLRCFGSVVPSRVFEEVMHAGRCSDHGHCGNHVQSPCGHQAQRSIITSQINCSTELAYFLHVCRRLHWARMTVNFHLMRIGNISERWRRNARKNVITILVLISGFHADISFSLNPLLKHMFPMKKTCPAKLSLTQVWITFLIISLLAGKWNVGKTFLSPYIQILDESFP